MKEQLRLGSECTNLISVLVVHVNNLQTFRDSIKRKED